MPSALRTQCLALMLALSAMTSSATTAAPTEAAKPTRVFISGHSLTDMPFPSYLAAVGQSVGAPLDWQRQYLVGSSIKDRTRGRGADSGWAGYRIGDNRSGSGLDILADFKARPYDVLLITEQHGIIDSLIWHDAVRHLRHYHDQFIASNPRGRTLFYEPWLGIPSRTDHQRWVSYERRAAPVWRCLTARINHGLALAGRADRIESLPAGLALAELVARATQGAGLEGLSQPTTAATLALLFSDDVHLNPLGFYYLALVSQHFISGRPNAVAWVPEGVSAAQARVLQQVASDFVTRYRADTRAPDAAQCAEALNGDFQSLYFDHRRDEYWAQADGNPVVKTWKRLNGEAKLRWRLHREKPLTWNAGGSDSGNWFGPP